MEKVGFERAGLVLELIMSAGMNQKNLAMVFEQDLVLPPISIELMTAIELMTNY